MTKNTNTSDDLEANKYNSKLLEDSENKIETLRQLLIQGEESGVADYGVEKLIAKLDERN